ncbi:MAG TPA: alpha/beta hydrolase [Casimicrobiaceae bacterium]|nr:alpha/beta hydrolase [Casimicrobiaceae bacterium]
MIALTAALLCTVVGHASAIDAREMTSVRDCRIGYRVHPHGASLSGLVAIISHGFLRNGDFMSGWAEAIGASGTPAVTVDLCASGTLGGRHADNAADLIALRRKLGIEAVVYVGVSAGGLASLIAAADDREATRGVLLLDPTNAGGQARSAAARVQAPVAALIAGPQMCNAWRNIDPALATLREATTVRIADASHCDFEWPTNNFCRVACVAIGSPERSARAQSRIRSLGVSFIGAIASGSPAALVEWRDAIADHIFAPAAQSRQHLVN